jgi:hypothetical protein
MARPEQKKAKTNRVTGSVIAGLLLVPATAIAAVAIVGATAQPPAAEAFDESLVSTTTEAVADSTTTTSLVAGMSEAEAVEQACTVSAMELINREVDETLTDLEAAALDALRQICEEHGMPIAGPPVPEAVVRVVKVAAPAQTTTTMAEADHDGEQGDYDEDHEDEDHEDKDHEDEDHEDEKDEKDEKDDD